MKCLLIDERMRKVEKEKLKNLGYELIQVRKSNIVYEEISSHVDIFVCKVGDKVIIEKSQFDNIKTILPEGLTTIKQGEEAVGASYPEDIKYNVCIIGKKAFHNFKYTDPAIKQELINQNYELINVKQGYTNCSIAVIDQNSAITSDKGLYKELVRNNIDTLFLDYTPDIKLHLNGKYSNKNGFIGGAMSRLGDNIVVFGDLNKIDKNEQLSNFIRKKNLNLIDFEGLDVVDYGGTVRC